MRRPPGQLVAKKGVDAGFEPATFFASEKKAQIAAGRLSRSFSLMKAQTWVFARAGWGVTGPFLPPRRRRHGASIVCNRCSRICWLRESFEAGEPACSPWHATAAVAARRRCFVKGAARRRNCQSAPQQHPTLTLRRLTLARAARASTGAQHHRTTNKKRRPETRPRALRRFIMLPIGERRRGTLPLHQRRRGRIKRLRVLQLDRMVVFTSDDTDVFSGGALYLTL